MMLEKLNLNQINGVLQQPCAVSWFESVDSTNEWCLKKAGEKEPVPFACFAEEQTQGRGRRGKHWVSPPGCNIYMSLAWSFDWPIDKLGILSLAMGLAVIRALEKAGIQQAALKWPNDVLVDDKKIAGILIETAKAGTEQTTAIIGVGLNYQLPMLNVEWTDVVTSLGKQTAGKQTVMQRSDLAGSLLRECMNMCERLPREHAQLIDEFNSYDACNQAQVSVLLDSGEQLQGTACGVSAKGEIRVLIDDEERVFNSAEISLRRAGQASTNTNKENTKASPC